MPSSLGVDGCGFFTRNPPAASGPLEPPLPHSGSSGSSSSRMEKEAAWWRQSFAAFTALSTSDGTAPTNNGSSSCRRLQRQLAAGWWRRLASTGGLPSCHGPVRPVVWAFLSGAGRRPAAQQVADAAVYEQLADAAEAALRAHRCRPPHDTANDGSDSGSGGGGGGGSDNYTAAEAATAVALECIARDLPRTFPRHCLFAASTCTSGSGGGGGGGGGGDGGGGGGGDGDGDGASASDGGGAGLCRATHDHSTSDTVLSVPLCTGQRQLFRVLGAYAAIDPAVGYCQGMAFAAAVLLTQAPEADAFQLLRHAMAGERLRLRELYLPGFPLLARLMAALRGQTAALLPRLHAHLAAEGVEVADFAAQWFLTLFTALLPMAAVWRLVDCFLLAGWRVWLQAALWVLGRSQAALLALDMEALLLRLHQRRRHGRGEEEGTGEVRDSNKRHTDDDDDDGAAAAIAKAILAVPLVGHIAV